MEDFSERLLTHYVAGRWRAPFSVMQMRLPDTSGAVVMADAQDINRAVASLRGADAQARCRLADTLAGFGMAEAMMTAPDASAPVGLCHGAQNRSVFAAALGAGLCHGVIWCPPISAAQFATRVAIVVQQADLPPGAFALLHTYTAQTEALLCAAGLRVSGASHI